MNWAKHIQKLVELIVTAFSTSQYVHRVGEKTASSTITCDIPHGPIPVPPLVNFYINDINSCSEDLKIAYFTDEITLHAEDKSLSGLPTKLNTEIHKAVKCLQAKRLSLNVSN